MLPARWRRSTFLTEQMNTLSSFLWNGDLNLPLMEVLPMDNDKKYKLPYVWKLLSVMDMIMVYLWFSDTVDSITPDKVRGLRDMLNSSAMDIMYYTSPLYRDEVTYSYNLPLFHSFCSLSSLMHSSNLTRFYSIVFVPLMWKLYLNYAWLCCLLKYVILTKILGSITCILF